MVLTTLHAEAILGGPLDRPADEVVGAAEQVTADLVRTTLDADEHVRVRVAVAPEANAVAVERDARGNAVLAREALHPGAEVDEGHVVDVEARDAVCANHRQSNRRARVSPVACDGEVAELPVTARGVGDVDLAERRPSGDVDKWAKASLSRQRDVVARLRADPILASAERRR